MNTCISSTFAHEEGPDALEGKTVYIQASRKQFLELAGFFAKVAEYVEHQDLCHMHFMDSNENWDENEYVDFSIELVT